MRPGFIRTEAVTGLSSDCTESQGSQILWSQLHTAGSLGLPRCLSTKAFVPLMTRDPERVGCLESVLGEALV